MNKTRLVLSIEYYVGWAACFSQPNLTKAQGWVNDVAVSPTYVRICALKSSQLYPLRATK